MLYCHLRQDLRTHSEGDLGANHVHQSIRKALKQGDGRRSMRLLLFCCLTQTFSHVLCVPCVEIPLPHPH